MHASDIHLEPAEDALRVRCRIDGVLHELREFPKDLQAGILSRIKIMGNLNIAERRLPQDGRTSFELSSGEGVDLRLASIPSMYGENITIRILEVSALPPTLASLGLTGENLARFEEALKAPEGGIVIVGPTGSGKSTTLYTTLELIKSPQRKVYTVEDPIERKIDGIIQTRGQAGHRPHLRPGAARPRARRPRRDHGRRDPRPGDRQDGRRLGHHRPPGLQHPAHQRRLVRRQPARRDGRAALPRRRGLALLRRAAAGAPPVPQLPQRGAR